ncbi:MAG: type III CRISPR-associated RAMP protein Csx7 [Anaerolineae bacterium]
MKRLVNEAYFTLTITTTGPILVRSGHVTLTGPDMTPVLTYRDGDWQVYLPGSSLKGVIRSHLEKVGRTLQPRPDVICNPFHKHPEADAFCGDKFQRRKDNKEEINSEIAYHDSCPICRLFGSTEFIGRVSINDAYLVDGARARPTETRDSVGIDRLTGGAFDGAKFELKVVSSNVAFQTDIYLRNFETWQLGMLLLVAQDMADGLVRIGSGRSRGLGSVRGRVDEVIVSYLAPVDDKPLTEVWGLGKFQTPEERQAYRTWEDDLLTLTHAPQEGRKGLRQQAIFSGESLDDLKQQASAAFVARLQSW